MRLPVMSSRIVSFTLLVSSILVLPATVASAPAAANGGPLIQQDFNGAGMWPQFSIIPTPKAEVSVRAARKPVGTIDTANSATPSGGLLLSVSTATAKNGAGGGIGMTSGLLPVRTTETNLSKLTLSFDHSVSSVLPVTVQIESFDAKKKRTGGREGIVYPAAPNFFLRSALELSTMRTFGAGAFRSTDPFVRLNFRINNLPAGTAEAQQTELRVDNVAYASPAFYVSPKGSDKNDGRTEKTAFANPQKALDSAQPGDIILVMNGTYLPRDPQEGTAFFRRAGTPASWITLKNYPGHKPVLSNVGAWAAIRIGSRGTAEAPSALPALAYLEVRGLHIRGNADTIKQTNPELIDQSNPLTNGNGISIEKRFEANVPHHIRIADNLVEYCSGGGVSGIGTDWTTVENNTIRNNCWWMIYAGSGVSFLDSANFDASDNVYKMLVRNNTVSGNRCFVQWRQIKKISDGNGIIVDTNYVPAKKQIYLGRTLVQNNVSFNNGGSGIHAYKSHRVDIINNTAYHNGASPELNWGQIFVQVTDDMRLINNILVSRPGQPINSVGPDGGDQKSTNVMRAYNLYFGGLPPKLTGEKDVIADPLFINASTDFAVADFRLRPGSPAIQSGWQGAFLPLRDLEGKPRPKTSAPDRGAYQRAN